MRAITGSIVVLTGAVHGAGAWLAESSGARTAGIAAGVLLIVGFVWFLDGTIRGDRSPPS